MVDSHMIQDQHACFLKKKEWSTKYSLIFNCILDFLHNILKLEIIKKKMHNLGRDYIVVYNDKGYDSREEEIIKLSSREIDVLEQLSKGLNYINIAENLFLSPATVRKHIENIYTKLKVHNKLEAVQKAKKNNLI